MLLTVIYYFLDYLNLLTKLLTNLCTKLIFNLYVHNDGTEAVQDH